MTTNRSAFLRLRMILCAIPLLGLIGVLPQRTARAAGTFISAPERVDMVHDSVRDVLYISARDAVLRYELATQNFIAPFQLGGNLAGLDLSPDGKTLVVADLQSSANDVWVHVIDVASGESTKATFPRAFYEGGTFTVAFGNDGNVLITSTFQGSGWVPMRRYNLTTGAWTEVASVRQNTMLAGSADGSVIGFAQSNISDGPVGRYRVADGNLLHKSGYAGGTGWFNYEIGANRNGTQYAVPTYGGTFIFDANLTKITTIGQYAGPQPIGVVYHPRADIVYFAWSGSTEVRAYDSTTLTQVGAYNFDHTFAHTNNVAFTQGRLKMSRDGSLLFATVEGGVRYVHVDPLPVAFGYNVQTDEEAPVGVTLRAESGKGGSLTYHILTNPQHGTLSGVAPDLTYTPALNYNGTDSFTFKVNDGTVDSAPATVSITVNAVNDAPVADAQAVTTDEDLAKAVTLTGSDVDGDALTYRVVTQPAHGSLSGTAPNLTYTPAANYAGPDSFTFKVTEGTMGSNTATVTIDVRAVNDAPDAVNDAATTPKATAVTIPVLLNDTDVDSVLTVTGVTQGAKGSVTINTDGTVKYVPQRNFSGMDTFTYTSSDGSGGADTATVTVTVGRK